MNSNIRWVLALIVSGSCILGFWGYFELIPGSVPAVPRILEASYHTVRLFTVEFVDPVTAESWGLKDDFIPGIQLQLARFLAPLATLATLLGAFSVILQSQMKHLRLRFLYHGHQVVLGKGPLTRVLVENLLDSGHRVALVHEGVEVCYPPRLLKRSRLLYLDGNETRMGLLGKLNLASARAIFFTSEQDEHNLIAAILSYRLNLSGNQRGRGRDTVGVLQLTRQSLVQQLKSDRLLERLGTFFRIEVFDPYDRIARRLSKELLKLALHCSGEVEGFGRLQVTLFGLGKVGSRVTEQLLRQAYVPGLPRLEIQLVDADLQRWAELCDRLPVLDSDREGMDPVVREQIDLLTEAMGFPKVSFFGMSAQDFLRQESREQSLDSSAVSSGTLRLAVVSLGQGLENYALASHVSQLEHPFFKKVYFRLHQRASEVGGFLNALMDSQSAEVQPLEPFGMAEVEGRAEVLLQPEIDKLARNLHAAYLDNLDPGHRSPATRPWVSLNEAYRDSNRAAADHLELKLAALGHPELPRSPDDLKELAMILEEKLRVEQEAGRLEPYARAEHDRWAAEKLLADWVPGPKRCDVRLRHPNLVPWDWDERIRKAYAGFHELNEADKAKDIRVILKIPEYLRLTAERD